MDFNKFELGHVEVVLINPSETSSTKSTSVRLVMSGDAALAYLSERLTLLAADGVETCADCKLEYTSSCPSLLGQKCQYFQPRR